jgi:hypothetical protein
LPPDEELVRVEKQSIRHMQTILTSTAGWIAGDDGLAGPISRLVTSVLQQGETFKDLGNLAQQRGQVADIRLVRGLLALETGDLAAAARHFQGSLRIGPIRAYLPDRPIAKRYVEILEGQ